ncbi:MAG: hypothetical protein AAFN41_08255 [Planctomycetota bacterium]
MRSPECPRCGYDLSGKLDGYRESCPLEDTCSECGCKFAWRNTIGRAACPDWFIEHPERSAWRTAAPTLLRLLSPHSFWRRVLMEQQPRWFRAVLAVVVVYVTAGAITAGVLGVEAWKASTQRTAQVARAQARPQGAIITFRNYTPFWKVAADVAATRVGGGLLFPLAYRDIDWEYYVYATMTPTGPRPLIQHVAVAPAMPTVAPLATAVAVPLLFMVPVSTRKRYRVQTWHIVRIGLYGLAGTIGIAFALNASFTALDQLLPWRLRYELPGALVWATLFVAGVWSVAWWSAATSEYLRIDRSRSFWLPLVGVGLLAGLVAQIAAALLIGDVQESLGWIPGGSLLS